MTRALPLPCQVVLSTVLFLSLSLSGAPARAHGAADAEAALDVEDLALQVTRLALLVFAQVRGAEGNVAVSPLSLAGLLAAVGEGGDGKAAAEAATVGRLGLAGERLRTALATLRGPIVGAEKGARLRLADALWTPADVAPQAAFAEAAGRALGLHVAPLEGADAVARGAAVSAWSAEQTGGLFTAVAHPEELDGGLVWTAAAQFSGGWGRPFRTEDTKRGTFRTADGRAVPVSLMHQTGPFGYARTDGVRVLEVLFATGTMSLVVVLPEKGDLDALEKRLDADRLERWLQAVRVSDMKLVLPRFRLATRARLDKALQALGLKRAFAKGGCGLTGIAPGGACLGAAVQAVRFELRESVPDAEENPPKPPQLGSMPPFEFRVDQPFLFLVRHIPTGAVVLIGHVRDPEA
jgi:serpin B